MKITKLIIPKNKIDLNLQFYALLKKLFKIKPSHNNILKILEEYNLLKNNIDFFTDKLKKILKNNFISNDINFNNDIELKLFIFSLKLYSIKDSILQESKLINSSFIEKLDNLDPLSLEYDKISVMKPYTTRVASALLTLLFFDNVEINNINFMTADAIIFLQDLSNNFLEFKKLGLEINQIFILIFTESINQSIISDSGNNYESRILSILLKNNIKDIKKIHDKNDKSTEFDFFFELNGRTFGIGAKRTLRERYKQFVKTAITSKIDIMIEITLGVDLSKDKADIITNKHGIYVFVSDEVYSSKEYLQSNNKVYSVKELNLKTLTSLK